MMVTDPPDPTRKDFEMTTTQLPLIAEIDDVLTEANRPGVDPFAVFRAPRVDRPGTDPQRSVADPGRPAPDRPAPSDPPGEPARRPAKRPEPTRPRRPKRPVPVQATRPAPAPKAKRPGRPGRPADPGRRRIGRALVVFYATFAGLATYGQSEGMLHWLNLVQPEIPGWGQRLGALAGGLVVELFAGILLAVADWRQVDHGERVFVLRLIANAAALGVAVLNWRAHEGDLDSQAFFVGISLAAFIVVSVHTAARRRDALRARGELAPPPPVYPLEMWLHSPRLVLEARGMAKRTPGLGLYGSLDAARAARAERAAEAKRRAAEAAERRRLDNLSELLLGKFEEKHPKNAQRARTDAAMYDTAILAAGLASRADHDKLIAEIRADLGYEPIDPVPAESTPRIDPVTPIETPEPIDPPAPPESTRATDPAESPRVTRPAATPHPKRPARTDPANGNRPDPRRGWADACAKAWRDMTAGGRPAPSDQQLADRVGCSKSAAQRWKTTHLKEMAA